MAQVIDLGLASTTIASIDPYSDVPDDVNTNSDLPYSEKKTRSLKISIETIVMSALIFIAILAWFEFLRTWFDTVFSQTQSHHFNAVYNRLWYAIFVTSISLILVYIVYHIANSGLADAG